MNSLPVDEMSKLLAEFYLGLTERGVPEEYASDFTRRLLENLFEIGRDFITTQVRKKDDSAS